MRTKVFYLALGIAIMTCGSCEKANLDLRKNSISPDNASPNLLAAIPVTAYDNFYDGIGWSFTNSPTIPATPGANTACGYSSNARWARVSWKWTQSTWSCLLYPTLATASGNYVNLLVPGSNLNRGAQIQTVKSNYSYGSYRAKLKVGVHSGTSAQGTVNGFFFYNSSGQEIDVEILTNQISATSKKVHFVTHSTNNTNSYDYPITITSDPTTTYIEYGFDWYANKVDFFINGTKYKPPIQYIPSAPGNIILNHWTGNPVWGGTPPPSASTMSINYIWHVPFLLVTYPDLAGIIWTKGTSKTITWNKYGDAASYAVVIELWKDGTLYQTLSSSASNTGSYLWTVPTSLPTASTYQIKIKSKLDSRYFDLSNNGFTIK